MTNPLLEENVASYETEKDCKFYCASEDTCCGCSKVCNVTCHWYSFTDCERQGDPNLASEKCTSKKPGNSIIQRR